MPDAKPYRKITRVLFIGNSATHVNDIPGTLRGLAGAAGFEMETKAITRDAYELKMHADASAAEGKTATDEIRRGFDAVFLQDHGNCIASDEKRESSRAACRTLAAAVRDSGGVPYIYVRPPYGVDKYGFTPAEQCSEYDRLFREISEETGAVCAHVNRAFAFAMSNGITGLWGPDMAHTSVLGAYLATCVIFSTLFGTSSCVLGHGDLTLEDAGAMQKIADEVALCGVLPW